MDGGSELRRLVRVVGAVVFLDTMFYAVIAPLLPELSHQLHLSKLSAGLLTASYPLGTLLASLPGGVLASRAGPRFALCTGLALLGCSTIAFGFLRTVAGLDVARFIEGVGGACSWAGGIAWIVAETPIDRRGATMGRALAAAIVGSLFGPAIGALASAIGRPALFCALAVAAAVLIAMTRRLPDHGAPSDQGLGALAGVIRKPSVAAGMWLMTLPAIASGLITVLGPLRLHRFGAGAGAIGAVFLCAAALEAVISPAVGSLSDRRGRLAPLRAGLVAAAVLLLCFTAPRTAVLTGIVIVVLAGSLGAFWAPSMAMLSEAAEDHEIDQGLAAALMNLAWAGGQIIGSGGGGAVAKATGDLVPTAVVAALCALTLAAAARAPRWLGRADSALGRTDLAHGEKI
jgi:predicted MFS family arabinose efflux permease